MPSSVTGSRAFTLFGRRSRYQLSSAQRARSSSHIGQTARPQRSESGNRWRLHGAAQNPAAPDADPLQARPLPRPQACTYSSGRQILPRVHAKYSPSGEIPSHRGDSCTPGVPTIRSSDRASTTPRSAHQRLPRPHADAPPTVSIYSLNHMHTLPRPYASTPPAPSTHSSEHLPCTRWSICVHSSEWTHALGRVDACTRASGPPALERVDRLHSSEWTSCAQASGRMHSSESIHVPGRAYSRARPSGCVRSGQSMRALWQVDSRDRTKASRRHPSARSRAHARDDSGAVTSSSSNRLLRSEKYTSAMIAPPTRCSSVSTAVPAAVITDGPDIATSRSQAAHAPA